ncbi:hypothetical protein ANTRET_LOCUS2384 [Anthophora retusa]
MSRIHSIEQIIVYVSYSSDDIDRVVAGLIDLKLAVGLGVCQPSLQFPSYTMQRGIVIVLTGGRSALFFE